MTHPNVVKYYKTFLEGEVNSFCPAPSHLLWQMQYNKHQKWKNIVVLLILGDKLYIVMELIEGLPLADHFGSLKEKKQQFTEDRIWNIFIQVTTLSNPLISWEWHLSPLLLTNYCLFVYHLWILICQKMSGIFIFLFGKSHKCKRDKEETFGLNERA